MGITINGLVIERPEMPELELYFREVVTGGPSSFVIKARDRRSFADAIMKKLILEIAGGTEPARQAKAIGPPVRPGSAEARLRPGEPKPLRRGEGPDR